MSRGFSDEVGLFFNDLLFFILSLSVGIDSMGLNPEIQAGDVPEDYGSESYL
jgi:hypothetical protein